MPWIILIVLVTILASFLWTWVKNYERESAEAAHQRIEQLEDEVLHLTERIENLEAINTDPSGVRPIDAGQQDNPEATYRTRTRS